MKKIIMLLFSFILLTSVTACSESPEKLYGFYKNINEEQLDRFGNVETLSITKDKIKFSNWDFAYRIKSIENKKETWIITGEGPFEETAITFKSIDENTIEYIENDDNSVRKFIKITKEEFNKL